MGTITKRFMRVREVMQRTGKSKGAIYGAMKLGQFPLAVRTGERSVAWVESDIDEWMDKCIATSATEHTADTVGAES